MLSIIYFLLRDTIGRARHLTYVLFDTFPNGGTFSKLFLYIVISLLTCFRIVEKKENAEKLLLLVIFNYEN